MNLVDWSWQQKFQFLKKIMVVIVFMFTLLIFSNLCICFFVGHIGVILHRQF